MRLVTICLLTIAIAGAVLTFRQHQINAPLKAQYTELVATIGVPKVEDPKKYYVAPARRDDPMMAQFRVHWPEGLPIFSAQWQGTSRYSSCDPTLIANDNVDRYVMMRLSFADDKFSIFYDYDEMSTSSTITDEPAEVAFFKERWQEIEWVVLGEDGIVEFTADQALKFVELQLPEGLLGDLNAIAEKNSSSKQQPKYQTVLYRFLMGTRNAVEAEYAVPGTNEHGFVFENK